MNVLLRAIGLLQDNAMAAARAFEAFQLYGAAHDADSYNCVIETCAAGGQVRRGAGGRGRGAGQGPGCARPPLRARRAQGAGVLLHRPPLRPPPTHPHPRRCSQSRA